MTVELKRCPCGEVPRQISIVDTGSAKYMFAVPSCCSEWMIEFRTNYHHADTSECRALAVEAWNNASRGEWNDQAT
jgi:hypothetical protein